MFSLVLVLHSLWRWVVLVLAVVVIARALSAMKSDRAFDATDNKLGAAFLGSVHLQVIVGLIMHFGLSPTVKAAMQMGGAAMRDAALRFWFVEHITMGVLVAILVTVVRVRAKKLATDKAKHKFIAIGTIAALAVMFAMIPWPFRPRVGRSLAPSTLVSN
ncbi:MAG: hypothetical protein U0269_29435 [Polyangiales bacterium]